MPSGPTITEHLPAEELKRLLLDVAAGERDALAELYRHTQTALDSEAWDASPAILCGLTHDERMLLQQALGSLGEEERRIVLLHTSGLKHREIALLLKLPLSTVLSKYHRSLKKMRSSLEGDDAV